VKGHKTKKRNEKRKENKTEKIKRNTRGTGCTTTQTAPHVANVQQNSSAGNQKQPKSNTLPETTYQRHNRGSSIDELNHHPT